MQQNQFREQPVLLQQYDEVITTYFKDGYREKVEQEHIPGSKEEAADIVSTNNSSPFDLLDCEARSPVFPVVSLLFIQKLGHQDIVSLSFEKLQNAVTKQEHGHLKRK